MLSPHAEVMIPGMADAYAPSMENHPFSSFVSQPTTSEAVSKAYEDVSNKVY